MRKSKKSLDHFPMAQRRPWLRNKRADLLALNTPLVATGRFIVFEEQVQKGSVVIVKGIVPYAQARQNPGTADETFVTILPVQGNGWFSFEPVVNGGSPLDILVDLNAPQDAVVGGVANANLNNNDRWKGRGYTDISATPLLDAAAIWDNPLFSFAVPSTAKLQIIFRLLTSSNGTVALANPISNPFQIAANAPNGRRVDFAGALIVGEIMPETLYHALLANAAKEEP